MTTEFPDPLTAVFTFADPNPLFMYNVARNAAVRANGAHAAVPCRLRRSG